ncbi:MAG: XRE family transcriptional regulator [Lachnospiraceae bacterium]|nr:XRE family transcriptional regulator [Lachnospiraceae bacterium]
MGRGSTKSNKNIYQLAREEVNMTRADVEDASDGMITESKLVKIENETQAIHQDDVAILAKIYNKPELCNDFCTNRCQIGQQYVPQVATVHELPQITMQLLSNLNTLNNERDRIIDIAADGKVTKEEEADFATFNQHLKEMSIAIESLKLWSEKELKHLQ